MRSGGLGSLLLTVVSGVAILGEPAAASVETIALSGQNPFGGAEDAAFDSFSRPSLNNLSQVAFSAGLAGGDVTNDNDTGQWISTNGVFDLVAREGDPAPQMPAGTKFGHLTTTTGGVVPLNDRGDVAFIRRVILPDQTLSSGVWTGHGGSLELVAAAGDMAPGAENGATFLDFTNSRASLNHSGSVAFTNSLAGAPYSTVNSTNTSDGVWVIHPDGTAVTALAGMDASAIGQPAEFTGFRTFIFPALSGSGQVAFSAAHLPSGATQNGTGVWNASSGGVELVGYSGEPLPEFGPSATLNYRTVPTINSAGTVTVNGSFSGAEGEPSSGTAIVVADAGGTFLAAYSGGPAPGAGAGHEFGSINYEPVIGSGGQIAFYGNESPSDSPPGSIRSGIWAGPPDDLRLVVRQGDQAPGVDATFGSFFRNSPAINRFGQIAFSAFLEDNQSSAAFDSLWATNLDGDPTLIARVGQMLEVAPGDERMIRNLSMLTLHGDDDGHPRGLNDWGQVAFLAGFEGGTSGVFLSNAVAHPEPSTGLLSLWLAALVGGRRRARRR